MKKNKKIVIIMIIIIILEITIYQNRLLKKEIEVQASIAKQEKSEIQNQNEIKEEHPEIPGKTTDWELILINKENPIPENYKIELSNIENAHKVDNRIKTAIEQMLADARKQGLQPYICSSYRTRNTQKTLYNKKVAQYRKQGYTQENAQKEASYWVAIPTSENEIGLALDIVSKKYQILDEKQESTQVQKWLIEHCTEYGFILRYPTLKKDITMINYEPWHYRYVGIENAKFMKEHDMCLEEYIEYLKKYE